jgi:hypothetical protein
MIRRMQWALLVAAGVIAGSMFGSNQRPQALAADADDPIVTQNAAILAQLKEVNAQLKEINGFLHNGTVKTIAVMNPGG